MMNRLRYFAGWLGFMMPLLGSIETFAQRVDEALLERFYQEASNAWTQHQKNYEGKRILATVSESNAVSGLNREITREVSIAPQGNHSRVLAWLNGRDSEKIGVAAMNPDYYFEVSRETSESAYLVTDVDQFGRDGISTDFMKKCVGLLDGSQLCSSVRLSDLTNPKEFSVVRCHRLDSGDGAVQIEFKTSPSEGGKYQSANLAKVQATFDSSRSWLPQEATLFVSADMDPGMLTGPVPSAIEEHLGEEGSYFRTTATYQYIDIGFPHVAKYVDETRMPDGTVAGTTTREYTVVDHDASDQSIFYLSAYGIQEPHVTKALSGTSRLTRLWICLLATLLLAFLAWKRSRPSGRDDELRTGKHASRP